MSARVGCVVSGSGAVDGALVAAWSCLDGDDAPFTQGHSEHN